MFWGKGVRGARCLEALTRERYDVDLVVTQPGAAQTSPGPVAAAAGQLDLETLELDDPNAPEAVQALRDRAADLFVLGGYGLILRPRVLAIPKVMTVNLHAGKLPQYRGSSPMNWALINGDPSFTLSIIRVDAGVDSGDVLAERTFPISTDDTIVDLHRIANETFPEMLLEVMQEIEDDALQPRAQDPRQARYLPLRFADDGLVLWDTLTAEQVHNRIRALRPPYPGAFTFFDGRRVTLVSSALREREFAGEPGRVYRKTDEGLLICATDRCLWVREAVFTDDGSPLADAVDRYDRLATVQGAALRFYEEGSPVC